MKIERINERTIRCVLTRTELKQRHLDVRDMAYGSSKINQLFDEMMQQALVEVGFQPEHGELLIEATPLEDGAIQLVISAMDVLEELDSRFSKFASSIKSIKDIKNLARELLEGSYGSDVVGMEKADPKLTTNASILETENLVKIFMFEDMDKAADACKKIIYKDYESVFYKDEENGIYYLVLTCANKEKKRKELNIVCNNLAEYGAKIANNLSDAYFKEHYKILIKNNAVEKLSML